MMRIWQPRMAAIVVMALGLAGCVAYEPAPAYYSPPAYYYGPGYAYGPSFNFVYRGGGGERERHWH